MEILLERRADHPRSYLASLAGNIFSLFRIYGRVGVGWKGAFVYEMNCVGFCVPSAVFLNISGRVLSCERVRMQMRMKDLYTFTAVFHLEKVGRVM